MFSTARLPLPYAQLKASVSKATELRSQRDTCLAPCDAACGSTHVTAAAQKRAKFVTCVCVHIETHQRVKGAGEHTFGLSKEVQINKPETNGYIL